MPAEQRQPARTSYCVYFRIDRIGVHQLRLLAGKPQHYRFVTGMALAGSAERTEQLAPDAGNRCQQARFPQQRGKLESRTHRSDCMGTRWTDPDFEQVEYAYGHRSDSRLSGLAERLALKPESGSCLR